MATIKRQQKITPFLWFNKNAEEAVKFYISVFKNSKKGKVSYCAEGFLVIVFFEVAILFMLSL